MTDTSIYDDAAFDVVAVRAWIADEVEPADARELQDLLDAATGEPHLPAGRAAGEQLAERFSGLLTFGTAGLRGIVRAGPNGMNRAVVRRASAGVVSWLTSTASAPTDPAPTDPAPTDPALTDPAPTDQALTDPAPTDPAPTEPVATGPAPPNSNPRAIVVVGYDARHGSAVFARDAAGVFAAAGFDARLLPAPLPTPVLAYSVLALGAVAGVMITASHNPKQDNGYKLYGGDGRQIVAPVDAAVERAMRELGATRAIAVGDYTVLDDAVVAGYVADVAALVPPQPSSPAPSLRRAPSRAPLIVHTALHGVGTEVLRRVFSAAGLQQPLSVAAQAEPDPEFPTVPFPNPEESGALDLAIELAESSDAALVIASDPDADRCAVALEFPDTGWRALRGDELGVLLADALLATGVRGTFATTIVSSSMLAAMARDAGVEYHETLTGFKWIMRAADDLGFGYEEALGYAVAPRLVRDKDGISAALVIATRAAALDAAGSSLVRRLDEMVARYGLFATDQISVRVENLAAIAAIMDNVRTAPPAQLLGRPVTAQDLLPSTDGMRLSWSTGRVVIRPSGTEPKIKAYLELVTPAEQISDVAAARRAAGAELALLRIEISELLAV